ncbi:CT620/CT621 family type III secretion system effector [Chlamydia vaughanii]|uniref:CT620/CT621 family type III secretion system effector n=1 Tax=Chlamydia vaughanii TaxID=3112552 RepID=UPI0032B21128
MSSFYIQNRPQTISGTALFNIKLDNKFSNFNTKTQPAIDIEALNSGLYALKRLANVLEAGNCHASMLLNPNNTIFPTAPLPKRSSNPSPGTNPTRTMEAIQEETALALVPVILSGLDTLIASVTTLSLAQVSSVILAIALVKPLKDKTSLDAEEQKKVFGNCYQPTQDDLLAQIKKEKAPEIQVGKDKLEEQLTASGATEEQIKKALEEYEAQFASDFFDANVAKQLMAYRSAIGAETSKMMQAMKDAATKIPEPTKDNVESVNGMVALHAIFDGLTEAVKKTPALGGDKEVIQTQLALGQYLNKTILTADELKTIYTATVLPSQATLDAYLSSKDGATYREGITGAYQTAVQNLTNVRAAIENEKKTLENQLALFQQAVSCFTTWVGRASSMLNLKSYTSEIVTVAMESVAGLTTLSQMYGYLTPKEQDMLNVSVEGYLDLQINTGNPQLRVADFIARPNSFQEIAEFTLQNAIDKKADLKFYLKSKGYAIATFRFFSKVGNAIVDIAENSLSNYAQDSGGYQIPHFEGFVNQIQVVNRSDFPSDAQDISSGFNTTANTHIAELQKQIAELEKRHSALNPADASFTEERKNAVVSWLNSESLGSAFVYLILHSQLPKQSAFLNPLIEEINFNNLAANAINDLLRITNNFSTTSVYYNLSSYLIQSKKGVDLFAGDYYETLVAISKEKEHIARDTDRCKRAQALVDALLKKIQALPGISSSQKSEMLNATANYHYALTITFNQLNTLNALLSNLKLTPEKQDNLADETIFKMVGPKDWIPTLAALEGLIANGFPNITVTGGLGPLFTQIQSDQQNYTTQSQTQQLNLQNQMSNIQQEWTLVSTSMQVLNKILSMLAGEVYPN